jgi:hypothetical protein
MSMRLFGFMNKLKSHHLLRSAPYNH